MSYKTVQDLDAELTIALGGKNKKTGKNNPQEVEGYYLGKRKVASKKAKSGFCYIHYFQTEAGNIGVWGKTDLDRKMEGTTVGHMVRASFDKMVATPNGDMYKYKVEFDPENTIEVQSLPSGDSNDTNDNEEVSEQTDTEDEDMAQAAALAQAERKAKVEALLNKKTKQA